MLRSPPTVPDDLESSAVNVAKVKALLAEGRMRPPGLAEVEAAQADGRWARAARS